MRKLTHTELLERQVRKHNQEFLPLVIVADNIRSLQNVGSLFRTADGVGAERLILCGICGYPPQSAISKTSLGAEDHVCWEYYKDVVKAVSDLKKSHYTILALEQMSDALDYTDYRPSGPVALIVGNEVTGLSDVVVPLVDAAIEIPMSGVKNSLNVSVAAGIAAYQIAAHLKDC